MLSWQRLATVLTIGFVAIFAVSDARADQYPSRQVTIVVPYPAGVPFDLLARALAERLRPKLGGAVIVENRPGANGVVATQAALQAKPDGHTLLLGSSAFTSIPLLMDKPGYATTDFTAVAPLGMVSYMLLVGGNVPANDIPSVVAYRKRTSKINVGVLAAGGTVQLLARRLAAVANVELTEIRYRGSTDMATAMLAGDIQMMFSAYNSAAPLPGRRQDQGHRGRRGRPVEPGAGSADAQGKGISDGHRTRLACLVREGGDAGGRHIENQKRGGRGAERSVQRSAQIRRHGSLAHTVRETEAYIDEDTGGGTRHRRSSS